MNAMLGMSAVLLVAGLAAAQPSAPLAQAAASGDPDEMMKKMTGMAHQVTHMFEQMVMPGMYGPYPMTRESSGTAWQPQDSPMEGTATMKGPWMLMAHGFACVTYTDQGGRRGADRFYAPTMLMGMAGRPLGSGTFGARAMLSADPATIGRKGYPELLQTGETADGKTPLIDHQHPHDLFMELAASYSLPVRQRGSVFVYGGLPGEPALGPPTFMHRFSGVYNPEAPITHHWLDATHITFGVATIGATWRTLKLDGSVFTGREPNQHRWDFDRPRMDSYSGRLSWNPTARWALQLSSGWIHSPEQLHPEIDVTRTTASAMYARDTERSTWVTTIAWGRNADDPGHSLDGGLVESAVRRGPHTVFGRAESVRKDGLFPEGDPRESNRYLVHKVALGYLYEAPLLRAIRAGLGGLGSVHLLPRSLRAAYGDTPVSWSVFARADL